jgi:hypothetical protein
MDDESRFCIQLQHQYGGQYVIRRGRKVLLASANGYEIADWIRAHRPLPHDVLTQYVERPDILAVY